LNDLRRKAPVLIRLG